MNLEAHASCWESVLEDSCWNTNDPSKNERGCQLRFDLVKSLQPINSTT